MNRVPKILLGRGRILDLFRNEVEFENIQGYDDIKDLVEDAELYK